MVQTNYEEMQRLGEKLQQLVAEARPLLKDLQIAIRSVTELENNLNRKLERVKTTATEAAISYKGVLEIEDVIDIKLKRIIETINICDEEIDRLIDLHIRVQQDLGYTVTRYMKEKKNELKETT